jgi:hypothetical protein
VTESAPPSPAPPLRTWRPMVLWTLAILLALGLIGAVALVVIPTLRLRGKMIRCQAAVAGYPHIWPEDHARAAVAELGSPRRAILCLRLYRALPDSMAPYPEHTIAMLGYCGRPAMPTLLRCLGDEHPTIRGLAAEALGSLRDPETIGPIAALLDDADRFPRESAAIAFGRIGDPRALPLLARTLGDDVVVRGYAVRSIASIGGPEAIPLLEKAAQDQDQYVRAAAAEALAKIRHK